MLQKVSVRISRAGKYSGFRAGRKVCMLADERAALEWLADELALPERALSQHSSFDIHAVMRYLAQTRNRGA